MVAIVVTVFMTVSEQKSKVRLISAEYFRVFVFSIRANSKSQKSRKDFSGMI